MNKIFVNHYLKEVEIGAFQSERGCTQRIEFNVILEISPISEKLNDNVDRVLSYEIIVDAINDQLQSQRFNLLETLAEKVAKRCLEEPRVIKADVRIEKLDRIPGTLGVHISRTKLSDNWFEGTGSLESKFDEFSLINFSSFYNGSVVINNWISAMIASNKSFVIIVEPSINFFTDSENDVIKNNVNLLAMDQNAWLFSGLDNRLYLATDTSELSSALKLKKLIVLCPSQFVKQSSSEAPPLKNCSHDFARWLSQAIGIKKIYFVGFHKERSTMTEDEIEIISTGEDNWKILDEQ